MNVTLIGYFLLSYHCIFVIDRLTYLLFAGYQPEENYRVISIDYISKWRGINLAIQNKCFNDVGMCRMCFK